MFRLRITPIIKLTLAIIMLLVLSTSVQVAYADETHIVQPGETMYSISRRYGVPISDIVAANSLSSATLIFAGQTLIIPTGSDSSSQPETDSGSPETPAPQTTQIHYVRYGETMGTIANRYGVSITALAQANGIVNTNLIYVGQALNIPGTTATPTTPQPTPVPAAEPQPSSGTVHVVSFGDTLSRIAIRYGVTVQAIMTANGLANGNFIYVGQSLNIPGGNVAAQPTQPTTPSNPTPNTGGTMFGAQTQSFAGLSRMQDTGMTWVKFQHKWGEGDTPGVVSGPIKTAHDAGFKILLSMPGQNTYPDSIDFNGYVNFLQGVAQLSDPPDAIEIWNEMNIDFEWPAGEISPSTYVNSMLAPAYNAIKAANPNILVISGAPAPTGFDNNTNAWADDRYMRGFFAAGGTNYLDCVGVHFNAGATSPNTSAGHPGGTHYSWYYTPMVTTYYNATGGRAPLCFTEIGYLSGDGFNSLPPNFGWASGTSLDEHAAWLAEAAQLSRNDSRVMMFIVFNFDFTFYDEGGDPQAGYGMVRPDGSCPACDRMKPIIAGG